MKHIEHMPKLMREHCLSRMDQIELRTGKMIHETHPELERSFWEAVDNKQYKRLSFVLNQLNKVLDELN